MGEEAVLFQGCVLGQGVQLPPGYKCSIRLQSCQGTVKDKLINRQNINITVELYSLPAYVPGDEEDLKKVGDHAYVVKLDVDDSDSEDGDVMQIWNDLYCDNQIEEVDGDSDVSSEMSDESDRSMSPVLDDTKCRFHLLSNLFYQKNPSCFVYNVTSNLFLQYSTMRWSTR